MPRNERHWKRFEGSSLESQVVEIKEKNTSSQPQNTQAIAPPEALVIPTAETKEKPKSAQGKKSKIKKTRKKKESE
jgi:hypothetical protein